VSTQPSSKSRLLKEGAKAGDFVSVEQPINDERPLNKRLRDEASEWDVDEPVVHLFVEAADAIEHMAAALVAVRAEREEYVKALVFVQDLNDALPAKSVDWHRTAELMRDRAKRALEAAAASPGEETPALDDPRIVLPGETELWERISEIVYEDVEADTPSASGEPT
jgi:enamine deaminase RidA (YjgF/YER057c/UK114 family)